MIRRNTLVLCALLMTAFYQCRPGGAVRPGLPCRVRHQVCRRASGQKSGRPAPGCQCQIYRRYQRIEAGRRRVEEKLETNPVPQGHSGCSPGRRDLFPGAGRKQCPDSLRGETENCRQ